MIELRWLIFEGGHKVLQSRCYYDKTIYATLGPNGDFAKQMVWSEWRDIPQHLCAVVNGERKVLERAL